MFIARHNGCNMAKPNYSFAKRQRDLAKKQKKEEKRLRKAGTPEKNVSEGQVPSRSDGEPVTKNQG